MKGAVNGALIISLFLLFSLAVHVVESRVAYDRRALVVNGQRRILFSGSMHYARSTPQMWEDLIRKAKDGGLDVIQTYVFWNGHEPSPGKYNFKGRFDLVRFVKTVHKAGLYVHLRLGPYACAEWNFGGFPVWLKYVPGISFRTDNKPFKKAMHNFTRKIVHMMKDEKLYHSQGGPIILSQIENEYGGISKMIGAPAKSYISWAAKMAVGLNTGVPWVMCKQDDAPDPVINTCNGFYCDSFTPNKPSKPKIWTEAWTSWFSYFGGPVHKRPVEDLAFAVARFVQNGGSFINYYMYHGGTNFGRTAGGPFITTTYDFDAPIDEYGLINAPKYDHLAQLHLAIKQCEKALVWTYPNITSFGKLKQVNVFSSESDGCAAFLTNYSPDSTATFHFNSKTYKLPPWSVSILQDCRKEVYNTAKVKAKPSQVQMVPSTNKSWSSWKTRREAIPSPGDPSLFSLNGLLEQINVTRDKTDYLWYTTNVYVSPYEAFLSEGHFPVLTVHSQGHGLHVFINGNLSGTYYGNSKYKRFRFSCNATLQHGLNSVALLSVAVGLPNIGLHYETRNTGIIGPVLLYGLGERRDLSQQKWYYQVGLQGEEMNLPTRSSSSQWKNMSTFDQTHVTQPLTWHKAIFDAPTGKEPLGLNMGSMVKGHVWINGQSIGRYWTRLAQGNCTGCRITSTYRPRRCQTECGRPTQRWYHLPRSWLKPRKNVLVVFEEMGGYPSQITLARRLRYIKFTKKASENEFDEVNFASSFNGRPNQTNLLKV